MHRKKKRNQPGHNDQDLLFELAVMKVRRSQISDAEYLRLLSAATDLHNVRKQMLQTCRSVEAKLRKVFKRAVGAHDHLGILLLDKQPGRKRERTPPPQRPLLPGTPEDVLQAHGAYIAALARHITARQTLPHLVDRQIRDNLGDVLAESPGSAMAALKVKCGLTYRELAFLVTKATTGSPAPIPETILEARTVSCRQAVYAYRRRHKG